MMTPPPGEAEQDVLISGALFEESDDGSLESARGSLLTRHLHVFGAITKGARGLQPGDTLIVRPGAYDGILPDVIPSGTAEEPITVRSEVRRLDASRPQWIFAVRVAEAFPSLTARKG